MRTNAIISKMKKQNGLFFGEYISLDVHVLPSIADLRRKKLNKKADWNRFPFVGHLLFYRSVPLIHVFVFFFGLFDKFRIQCEYFKSILSWTFEWMEKKVSRAITARAVELISFSFWFAQFDSVAEEKLTKL